jgi:hypothetical protein
LGIGVGGGSSAKVEIYKEEGDKVVSVSEVILDSVIIASDYKAFYINKEKGYIGLGVLKRENHAYWSEDSLGYLIINFSDDKLSIEYELEIIENTRNNQLDYMRSTLIDGYFYILSSGRLDVVAGSGVGVGK